MKPRTIASKPDTNMTPSRTRSSIVIGIGWPGQLPKSKGLVQGFVESVCPRTPQNEGQATCAARAAHRAGPRGIYRGGGGERPAHLALLTSESRGCGIFLHWPSILGSR